MEFLLSPELLEFQKSLEKFFGDKVSSEMLRSLIEKGSDESVIRSLFIEAAELGVFLAVLPEESDGLGFGALGAQVALEVAGQKLAPLPLLEGLGFGLSSLLLQVGDAAKDKLLPRISSGDYIISVAAETLFNEQAPLPHVCKTKGSVYEIKGGVSLVPNLVLADGVLIFATVEDSEGLDLFLLEDLKSKGCSFAEQSTFDLIRPYASLKLDQTPVERLSEVSFSAVQLQRLRNELALHCVSELIGVGSAVLQMTLDYVKTRKQFGKPVGAFQAIQQELADMYLELQQARALARFAAWACVEDETQFAEVAPAAKAFASEVIPRLIERALQAHGGIGFTYEYDLHLFLRRAQMLANTCGAQDEQYRQVGQTSALMSTTRVLSSAG